ncbi:unnamed protein product, partial [marine sediment metagenome]
RKRDGRTVDFDQEKITKAVWAAAQAVGGRDRSLAERLSDQVVAILEQRFPAKTPTVENVQDIVISFNMGNGDLKNLSSTT